MKYKENIFTKIINKEIPSDIIYENNNTISFYDIKPQASIHVLIVPKKNYINYIDFETNGNQEEKNDIFDNILNLRKKLKIGDFTLITNNGSGAGQVVFHYHLHLLSNDILT